MKSDLRLRDSSTPYEDGTVDIGLVALVDRSTPGQTWTHRQIAHVCGCSKSFIQLIELTALKKLRKKMYLSKYQELGDSVKSW